jgi:hypothetical protein
MITVTIECCYAESHTTECDILFADIISVILMNAVMLSVIMLSVVEPFLHARTDQLDHNKKIP